MLLKAPEVNTVHRDTNERHGGHCCGGYAG